MIVPRPVRLALAGRVRLVSQFTLADLAAFERFAAGDFWGDLARAEAEPDLAARHAALRKLYDRAERPAAFGTARVSRAIQSPEGQAYSLWRSLRRRDRRLARKEVLSIAAGMTPPEWNAFDRVAWAVDPLDEVARVIDAELGQVLDFDPYSPDWPKAIRKVVKATGMPPREVARLTLSQWRALTGNGSHPVAEPERPRAWSGEQYKSFQRARRGFHYPDRVSAAASGSGGGAVPVSPTTPPPSA